VRSQLTSYANLAIGGRDDVSRFAKLTAVVTRLARVNHVSVEKLPRALAKSLTSLSSGNVDASDITLMLLLDAATAEVIPEVLADGVSKCEGRLRMSLHRATQGAPLSEPKAWSAIVDDLLFLAVVRELLGDSLSRSSMGSGSLKMSLSSLKSEKMRYNDLFSNFVDLIGLHLANEARAYLAQICTSRDGMRFDEARLAAAREFVERLSRPGVHASPGWRRLGHGQGAPGGQTFGPQRDRIGS
jgi:hypothetical protein